MISLSKFRAHLFPIFKLIADTGEWYEIVSNHKVYQIQVRKTDKKPALRRISVVKPHEQVIVDTSECENCGSIMFNGVCMNTKCSSSANNS